MTYNQNNLGNSSSGDNNSGDWNSGYHNSGDWNSGYRNSGDRPIDVISFFVLLPALVYVAYKLLEIYG